jgi:hypothetical protein
VSERRRDLLANSGVDRHVLTHFQITESAVDNRFARLARAAPSFHPRQSAFQFLINRKEVFDFPANVLEDLVHGVDLIVPGIPCRHGENLLIALLGINHVQDSDGPNLNHAAGETRFLDQDEHVHGIVVFRQRSGDEAVIARIMHRRIESAIQPKNSEPAVIFVFIRRIFRYFDDHAHEFRTLGTRVQIVQRALKH